MINNIRTGRHGRFFFTSSIVLLIFFHFMIPSASADHRTVTIGIYENAPKIFISKSGKPAGIFIDIIEYIAESEGWRLRYMSGTWGEGLDRLEKGEIDLMPDVAYTAEREKVFAFHKVPVLSSWFQVYARKGSKIHSILDLGGKRIAVLERSVQQEAFVRLADSFGLHTTLISLPDYQILFERVARDEADAAITNRFYGLMHAKKFGLEDTAVIFNPSNLFFAAPKGTHEQLLNAIDVHLTDLKKDTESIYYLSLKRWISEEVQFKVPAWLQMLALVLGVALLLSLVGSFLLKHQVSTRTQDLHKMNRALRTLSECNQALVHSTNEAGLLDAICRIVVDIGDYRLAWVGFTQTDTDKTICPVSQSGFETDDIKAGNIPQGHAESIRSLTNNTIRTDRPCSARHIFTNPDFEPLRTEALKWGYASALVLPLRAEEQTLGVLTVCSVEPDAFETQEVTQLTELADNLAFGIVGHRTRVAREQAEVQQQAAQQRFVDIVEFLPDATFVVDEDKKIIAWNQACEAMTGVKKEALIGQGNYAYAEPFFGERRPILIDLLDLSMPEVEATYKYIKRQGDRIYGEFFIPCLRDGQGAHLWGVASPLYDQHGRRCGAIETIQDVTEQKSMEETLRASEQKYRELVTLANSIILRWSRDGRITFLNEFGQRFFGYAEKEILGRHVLETIVPEIDSSGRDLHLLMEEICADPQKHETNINENMRRNGERVWIDWRNKAVLDEQGQAREILSIGSDITDRKQAEEKIRRLNDDLRRNAEILEQRVAERTAELVIAKDRAESADRIKSAFLATMSHELRTPLNSIIGFTGILLQGLAGPLNEEQRKQMTMVQGSSRHLLALINDVLDISKIEAGQMEISFTSFALRLSIEKTVKLVSPLAEKKGITLFLDIAEDVATVTTDQRRLEQILLNLLNNAVKFTEKGDVRISCRCDNDYYFLSVSDTGIGIQEEELQGLFQPFHQIDTGLSRKHEGTGLGLSICKKLLDMMGGTIGVESHWGQGSTFTVRFPR
ncbi:MAG: PAS domain S-box protein [Deltaproteobacteria bacterium]|nr:PAS domain S-box protein [Deltaproteobacteria bacterium]